VLLPNEEDLPFISKPYTDAERESGQNLGAEHGVDVEDDMAPIQVVGSGATVNDATQNAFDRAGKLLDMSEGEIRARCTFTGGVQIGRLPGVVQLDMLAPLDLLDEGARRRDTGAVRAVGLLHVVPSITNSPASTPLDGPIGIRRVDSCAAARRRRRSTRSSIEGCVDSQRSAGFSVRLYVDSGVRATTAPRLARSAGAPVQARWGLRSPQPHGRRPQTPACATATGRGESRVRSRRTVRS